MDELFRQIAWAAEDGLYFLALAGALVIPDICGALESPSGVAEGSAYKAWFDAHLAPLHGGIMDGDTCWKFRCSFLHQGTTQDPKGNYSRVMFVEPGATPNVAMHMDQMNDALVIDVRKFCREIVQAALTWQAGVTGTQPYETNIKNFVTRYPAGLWPYIGGVPVIS